MVSKKIKGRIRSLSNLPTLKKRVKARTSGYFRLKSHREVCVCVLSLAIAGSNVSLCKRSLKQTGVSPNPVPQRSEHLVEARKLPEGHQGPHVAYPGKG